MRTHKTLLLLCPLALALSSCSSVSVYQDAKTLRKGDVQMGMGLGAGKFNNKTRIPGFDPDLPALSWDTWARYGISDQEDAGIKLSLFGSVTADARHGLLNERRGDPVSVALGLTYVYTSASTNFSGHEDKTTIQDLMVPLYVSKDLDKWFTAYMVPRYAKRFIANSREYDSSATPSRIEYMTCDMFGMGGGIMFNLGRKQGGHLALEFHKLFDLSDPSHYTQNGGVAFSFEF